MKSSNSLEMSIIQCISSEKIPKLKIFLCKMYKTWNNMANNTLAYVCYKLQKPREPELCDGFIE